MDAMVFGVPIVTVDGHSRREIVSDGRQGFVIDAPNKMVDFFSIDKNEELIGKMTEKVELLIKDKKLRKKMGIACLKEVENGKFSIKKRNLQLKKIYSEAVSL